MDGSQGVPPGEIDSGRRHTFITQLKRICEDGRLDIFWLILKHLQDLAGRTLQKCRLREDQVRQACKLVEPVLPVRVSGDH